ncbi:DinB family protein [Nocardioides acrostichi]|uniref:TIGR03086 family protein n=1 Tax=Nocardioides acrostichi TaxID=2784339 RepID=A0A930Y5B8_9ACTN|nr:TIGR03086 family protein [Nocardioides acrostichi]MBF4161090.1 TIGR03086 family protein [Nocardioides acrostichi]
MTAALVAGATAGGSVELLERALGYGRVVLGDIEPQHLGLPTACTDWSLATLLAHLDDGLDAFLEAAGGRVRPALLDTPLGTPEAARIRDKCCSLLGVWTPGGAAVVGCGAFSLDSATLLGAAALEIAVHAWDATWATGVARPLPPALSDDLLPVAVALIAGGRRGAEFGPAGYADTAAAAALLGFLGRAPGGPAITGHRR